MPNTLFAGLSDKAWNELAGTHFYSRTEWLRYCTAETLTAGDTVAVRNATGDVVLAAPVRDLAGLPGWSRYRWNDYLAAAGLPELSSRGILVGPSEGFQTHLLTRNECGIDEVARFLEAVRSHNGLQERPAVAMFVSTGDARLLVEAGVAHVPVLLEADAWLEVPDGGWDEYVAQFRRGRRYNIRMERQKFADAKLTVSHHALEECWQTLGQASAALLRKYGHSTTPEREQASMQRMIHQLGARARVAVCHKSGALDQPSGFCVYYEHNDTVYIRWAGFDDTQLEGVYEYFNTLYYSQIERAQQTGTRWIHAGTGATAAKALRGAQLRPSWLIDLSTETPLARATTQIEHHNRLVLDELLSERRTAGAVKPIDDWKAFDHTEDACFPGIAVSHGSPR